MVPNLGPGEIQPPRPGKGKTKGRRELMSDKREENRVLSRTGARQIKQDELNKVTGGRNTRLSQIITGSSSDPDTGFDT
ncbi:MAG TPA: hypothetical protein VE783_11600 [Candidatus Limnocylindrales bacterium]|jgi:hypothetical protein|nr:hypothetical protein [Candidatus Limnocylindrales bacterium]